jgi:hypothetical protein
MAAPRGSSENASPVFANLFGACARGLSTIGLVYTVFKCLTSLDSVWKIALFALSVRYFAVSRWERLLPIQHLLSERRDVVLDVSGWK